MERLAELSDRFLDGEINSKEYANLVIIELVNHGSEVNTPEEITFWVKFAMMVKE